MNPWLLTAIVCGGLLGFVNPSIAQAQFDRNLFGGRGNQEKVTISASYQLKPDSRVGILSVAAEIIPNHQIYSTTQPAGGPRPSKITFEPSDEFKVIGVFEPEEPPHVDDSLAIMPVNVEHFFDKVVWSAPIQLSSKADPENVAISIIYSGQVCEVDAEGVSLNCDILNNIKAKAKFAGYNDRLDVVGIEEADVADTVYRPDGHKVEFTSRLVRTDGVVAPVKAGDSVTLEIDAKLLDGYYIYAHDPQKRFNTTLLVVNLPENWQRSAPVASAKPFENSEEDYLAHKDQVTWKIDIQLPSDLLDGEFELDGMIGFQNCNESLCLKPAGVKFKTEVVVGGKSAPFPVQFLEEVSWGTVVRMAQEQLNAVNQEDDSTMTTSVSPEKIAAMRELYPADTKIRYIRLDELDRFPVGSTFETAEIARAETGFLLAVGLIFLGGLILNLMPCVFPVLGLKVMGFVEQAGSDPKKVRYHGLAFTMGLVFSMWVLAGIVLILQFVFAQDVSWGSVQMSNPYFLGAIIVLLFLLGLNMAGVFEIGTSLTRVGGNVSSQKGYFSSFLTGILTTLIATPCSGPFLGTAMTYTLSQPATVAMFLFTVFALGIAAPYLVLSFFPSLISMMPRPGAWMHTFKVLMAFALFASVAFFMQTFGVLTGAAGLSWLVMALVVIALAAFFYGSWSPAYVKPYKRVILGWGIPAMVLGIGIWMINDAAGETNWETGGDLQQGNVKWEKWYPGKVEYLLAKEPAVIWTDYTATWCPTCLVNKKRIFSDATVLARLEELGVRTVKVDFTNKDDEIAADLLRSDQRIIPVNIIYPPNYPDEPAILLDGLISPADALKVFDRMEAIIERMENPQE